MASSTIRKAIGVVKDQTSISIAKVAGNVAPDLEVLIVKATGHDNEPAEEKYIREILNLTSHSRSYVNACVYPLSKRLSKTRDWIVALKALMLVHRLLVDGEPTFGQEVLYAKRKGTRVLNMSDFRDEAHSNSWDHSGFVKTYAVFLDQKLEFVAFERESSAQRFVNRYGDFSDEPKSHGDGKSAKEIEMETERVLERLNRLLRLLDRILCCKPTGSARNSRMVLVALYLVLKESFRVYVDIREALGVLLDRFPDLEYAISVEAFDAYVYAAKTSEELVGFYNWCKDVGLARSSEFPDVQNITDKLLGELETYVREKKNMPMPKNPKQSEEDEKENETPPSMNEIKALPPPENHTPPPPPAVPVPPPPTEDLLRLNDHAMSADAHGHTLALALFSGEPEVAAAWRTPAADGGMADWEVALVESASNLSKQKADMAGGLDSLLLEGMYDQGAVRWHVSHHQLSGGSSSSVVVPGSSTPMLALPAPDGTLQPVGPQDPFAASLAVPPPSYVQIADMERKQNLLVQEQQVWQQYGRNGMQGGRDLAKIDAAVAGMGQQTGYYHSQY